MVVRMVVEFRVLGDVGVHIAGQRVDVGHLRQQCVLVSLLADANQPVPAEALLDRAWGGRAPRRGRATVHSYVSRLRKILAPTAEAGIVRRPGGYVLTVDPMAVDLYCFGSLVERARAVGDDEHAGELLVQALGLWRGEAFPALDTPWLNALRETLNRQRIGAELDRYDVALRRGQHARLLDELSAAVTKDPWDERLAGQLMLALYRCGRQASAIALYHRLRRGLAEELGADPGPPLQRLHQQILTADPAVAAPNPASATSSAGVRMPAAADTSGAAAAPRQLPASPGSFTGRGTELTELSRHLHESAGAATVVISAIGGIGGIGKTWLALRWAHANVERFPDGQLYVNLRGFDPAGDPVPWPVAVRGFLDALGVDPGRVPADPQAQVGLYRSLVAGRRMLVVLDNARDTETVAQLLPGTGGSAVLVTSRHQLPGLVTGHGARPMALDLLPDSEARELLARQLGAARITAEPDTITELVRHCAGLPLALGIVAARAVLQPGRPLADLAAQLRTAGTRLDALDAGELSANLRAVLSCSVAALAPVTAEVFALVGLAPGPDIGLAAAASLVGRPAEETRGLLKQLLTANLVQEHAGGRYRMHDLVRLYAVELAGHDRRTDPADPARAALLRLFDHYLHTAYAGALLLSPQRDPLNLAESVPGVAAQKLVDLDEALAWFTAEYPVLLAAIRHAGAAGFNRHAYQLPWTLATFFDRQGHWDDWVTVQRAAVEAARRTADRPAQAQAHRLLANAYSNLRRYVETHANLRHALGRFEELGDDAGCAHVHLDIALLFDRQGQPAQALPHALRSLELYRVAGTGLQQAVALNAIGWYHSQLGEHRDAVGYCEQALALSAEAGSQYGQANTWDSLGYAHHHLGEHRRAAACYTEALALFRAIGDRHAEGIVLAHLGDTHDASGDATAARDAWRAAQAILDDLAHPEAAALRAKLR
jgi:DNA-binding SARP family transcriptional activator/tetratricopeptide (TPR) repeat protein